MLQQSKSPTFNTIAITFPLTNNSFFGLLESLIVPCPSTHKVGNSDMLYYSYYNMRNAVEFKRWKTSSY